MGRGAPRAPEIPPLSRVVVRRSRVSPALGEDFLYVFQRVSRAPVWPLLWWQEVGLSPSAQ